MRNEIYVSFCIRDYEDITAEDITAITGCTPFRVYVKGEPKRPEVNGTALWKSNRWLMRATADKHIDFKIQLNMLLDIIEPKVDLFKSLSEKYACEIRCALFMYYDNDESTPSVNLGKRYNDLAMQLNISFDLDLYCMSNADAED